MRSERRDPAMLILQIRPLSSSHLENGKEKQNRGMKEKLRVSGAMSWFGIVTILNSGSKQLPLPMSGLRGCWESSLLASVISRIIGLRSPQQAIQPLPPAVFLARKYFQHATKLKIAL